MVFWRFKQVVIMANEVCFSISIAADSRAGFSRGVVALSINQRSKLKDERGKIEWDPPPPRGVGSRSINQRYNNRSMGKIKQ